MRQALHLTETTRPRNLLRLHTPTSALLRTYRHNAPFRIPHPRLAITSVLNPYLFTPSTSCQDHSGIFAQDRPQTVIYRNFTSASIRFQEQGQRKDTAPGVNKGTESEDSAGRGSEEQAGDKSQSSGGQREDGNESKQQEKKEPPPPPPPHGSKSPWQVFTETLQSEFKASKEWNESTKAIASSAHQFTENESVKRAREAYSAASSAATTRTSSALKSTGKVIGQSAAWTWDTSVVKGVRSGVNATGRGIEKATRPVRETEVYKTAVGGVKDVIDDGSSSRYGGWMEKEERRKQKELRELQQAAKSGRQGRKVEKMEEDPK